MANKIGIVVGALAGAGVACAAMAGVGVRLPPAFAQSQPLAVTKASTATIFAPPPGAPLSFADIFQRVAPAVVSINVTAKVDAKMLRSIPGLGQLPFDLQPEDPRGGGGDDQDNGGDAKAPTAQSSGSGFFISADGYIVTNNHVVENATDIKVVLSDKRELTAKVVGRDENTDLAVIKVDGGNYPFVSFENSAKPRVGDWVIAIGNPFTLGGTATAGIVSAYGRDIGEQYVDYIQIDAPINRGNSGGPTFDIYGRVIGVNTAIFSPSGGSVGIGFAIPADVAEDVTHQLISKGSVTRGYLGATVQNFTPEDAEAIGRKSTKGAIIADVTPGGPAERAGLKSGDIVLAINGRTVESSTELTRIIGQSHAGDNLRLDVLRYGKPMTFNVRSGTRPTNAQLAAQDNGSAEGLVSPDNPVATHPDALGLTLAPIDEAAHKRFNIPVNVHGALILGVSRDSDAHGQVKAGDVVVSTGDGPVNGPADVAAAIANARKQGRPSVLVGIRQGTRVGCIPLKTLKGPGKAD